MPLLLSLSIALAACASACLPETVAPPGARISCEAEEHCPQGFSCRTSLGMCVAVGGADLSPPSLSEAVISPERLGLGAELAVSFEVNRPLLRDPKVELVFEDARTTLRMIEAADGRYLFAHAASGREPEEAAQVKVGLLDSFGNEAEVTIGVVTFDLSLPEVSGLLVERAAVNEGALAALTFRASEPLAEAPVVTLAGGEAWQLESEPEPLLYRYTYEVTGQEPEGAASLSLSVVDEAGNASSLTRAGLLRFDFTPPVVESAILLRGALREGQTAALQLTVSEGLSSPPLVGLVRAGGAEPLAMSLGDQLGTTYTYLRQVDADVADGVYEVRLTNLLDVAENPAAAAVLGTLVVDNAPPALLPGASLSPTLARVDATVRSSFTASEPLAAPPRVTLGGVPMSLSSQDGLRYSHEHTLLGSEGEGVKGVVVELLDAAGNLSFATLGHVTLDFTPPAVALVNVSYTPDARNPLATVTKATFDTLITVTVVAAEPLSLEPAELPVLTADNGTDVLAFTAVSSHAGGATFESYALAVSDGAYVPTLAWSDLAGNRSEVLLDVVIEVQAAEPALQVAQDEVVYVRSPWGNAAAESVGALTLPAGPYFALAPSDPLGPEARLPASAFALAGGSEAARVRVWASSERDALLGTLVPAADGSWPRQRLASQDVLAVYLSGIDEAGNESAAVKLQQGEWVASSNPPSFGSGPHALDRLSLAEGSPAPAGSAAVSSSAAAGSDGSAERVLAELSWRERAPDAVGPSGRYDHVLAYDSARNRTVLFGGRDSGRRQDTWEWGGDGWQEALPAGELPSRRESHAAAYDSARGRVLVFGGWDGSYLQDTWEWDGNGWQEQSSAAETPSARVFHALAYDSARGRVVLFGGVGADGVYRDDTWEWDGSRWQEVIPAGARPSARVSHALAYDSVRERVVLFGGDDGSDELQDTWEWDGAAWVGATPTGERPSARQLHAMAYDRARGRTVLFGGYQMASDEDLGDTWEWDGSEWLPAAASGGPSARDDHAMVYDSARERVLLFGGWDLVGQPDLWQWDGSRWLDATPGAGKPSARQLHAMVYEAARGRTLLFGGGENGGPLQDTWEWNGWRWRELAPAGPLPPPRQAHALAYDSVRERVVLFGGADGSDHLGDTWEWDGSAWADVTPAGGSPPARSSHAMAYDRARESVLLFGGSDGARRGDTWAWSGTEWLSVTPAGESPSARFGHMMAYDEGRERVVLFGGVDGSDRDDTWEWDGDEWLPRTPAGEPPPGRSYAGVAFDSERGEVVLFGGLGSVDGAAADTWQWDGSRWRQASFAGLGPLARFYGAMAYDAGRGQMVLFGGNDGVRRQDTWEWSGVASRQPAVQLLVSMRPSGIAAADLTGLKVRAHAGGNAFPYDSGSSGATLYAWRTFGGGSSAGGFAPLASNNAGLLSSQPWLPLPPAAALSADLEDPRELLLERDGRLVLQVRPSGVSGPDLDPAAVALDYLEVRLRYRLAP